MSGQRKYFPRTSADSRRKAETRCSVLLQIARAQVRRYGCSGELRGDAEHRVDELPLRNGVAFGDPADLTLADCVHCLVTFDRSTSSIHGSESEARGDPLLYEPMVLLNGLITNDKFCLARLSRQKLRYA